jgi:integrase
VVLSKEEVANILSAMDNVKHRAILMTVYSAGLRVGEVVRLKLKDIDTDRMLIHVTSRGQKGGKIDIPFFLQRHSKSSVGIGASMRRRNGFLREQGTGGICQQGRSRKYWNTPVRRPESERIFQCIRSAIALPPIFWKEEQS